MPMQGDGITSNHLLVFCLPSKTSLVQFQYGRCGQTGQSSEPLPAASLLLPAQRYLEQLYADCRTPSRYLEQYRERCLAHPRKEGLPAQQLGGLCCRPWRGGSSRIKSNSGSPFAVQNSSARTGATTRSRLWVLQDAPSPAARVAARRLSIAVRSAS